MLQQQPGGSPAATQEASNATLLNQTLGKLLDEAASGNADIVAALQSIATAVTSSLIGGITGTDANRILVSKGTSSRALQPSVVTLDPATGIITGATLSPSEIAFTATQRVLGRNTSGAGAGEEVTLTQLLDWISASVARGDILRRGAAAWERLGIGANNTVLTSDGTDPAWAAIPDTGGITTIASGSLSGTAVTITGIPATYAYLVLQVTNASSDTSTRQVFVRVSTDNGSSYDSTAGNYRGILTQGASTTSDTAVASLVEAAVMNAADSEDITITITGYQAGPWLGYRACAEAAGTRYNTEGVYAGSTSAIDAIQILWSGSGNFDGGTYALYGLR
jgi:hypothetical protein